MYGGVRRLKGKIGRKEGEGKGKAGAQRTRWSLLPIRSFPSACDTAHKPATTDRTEPAVPC
jgi:hypothetical protein